MDRKPAGKETWKWDKEPPRTAYIYHTVKEITSGVTLEHPGCIRALCRELQKEIRRLRRKPHGRESREEYYAESIILEQILEYYKLFLKTEKDGTIRGFWGYFKDFESYRKSRKDINHAGSK